MHAPRRRSWKPEGRPRRYGELARLEPSEDPEVVPEVRASWGPASLVTEVCTQLGPDYRRTEVVDVSVALCDGRTSCTTVGGLRMLSAWATAPGGLSRRMHDALVIRNRWELDPGDLHQVGWRAA